MATKREAKRRAVIVKRIHQLAARGPAVIGRFHEHAEKFNAVWRVYWKARCSEVPPCMDGRDRREGVEYEQEAGYVGPAGAAEVDKEAWMVAFGGRQPEEREQAQDEEIAVWFPPEQSEPPDPLDWRTADKLTFYYTLLGVLYDHTKGAKVPVELCRGILDEICFRSLVASLGSWDVADVEASLVWLQGDLADGPKKEAAPEPDKAGSAVALCDVDLEILYVLEERDALTTNKVICEAMKTKNVLRTESTIKTIVRRLLKCGLVARPRERKGVCLTAKGKDCLTRG
ncbi:MAG TPA: BlaI/MecI/CopY family transcriptional regulator [Sedimentisphaerales bacterium]|nr:BlaI/MecI/CopY family transcriptional regulator [Sedimentisphaerales bacterium]